MQTIYQLAFRMNGMRRTVLWRSDFWHLLQKSYCCLLPHILVYLLTYEPKTIIYEYYANSVRMLGRNVNKRFLFSPPPPNGARTGSTLLRFKVSLVYAVALQLRLTLFVLSLEKLEIEDSRSIPIPTNPQPLPPLFCRGRVESERERGLDKTH